MNMGLYSSSYLRSATSALDSMVVQPYASLSPLQRKQQGGEQEDLLLKPITRVYCTSQKVGSPKDVYGKGVKRISIYYPQLDLMKFQANWMVDSKDQFQMDA